MPAAPASTAAAVKAYLFTQLTARAELLAGIAEGTILVSYDDPAEFQPDDLIVVGQVFRTVQPYQMVGSGLAAWLEESYTVHVTVDVFRGGDQAQVVFERAAVLADVVVDVVRQDPSIGGLVTQANPDSVVYTSEWSKDVGDGVELYLGRHTTVEIGITVLATI